MCMLMSISALYATTLSDIFQYIMCIFFKAGARFTKHLKPKTGSMELTKISGLRYLVKQDTKRLKSAFGMIKPLLDIHIEYHIEYGIITIYFRFDTDRSGNIDARELNTAFHTFGYNL